MKTAFFLLLTFLAGPDEGTVTKGLVCPNLPCVEHIVSEGNSRGTRLVRLRVFADRPFTTTGRNTPFPPIEDYWFQ